MNGIVTPFAYERNQKLEGVYQFEGLSVDLEDSAIQRTEPNPISPIVTGFIRLRGVLKQVTWRNAEANNYVALDVQGFQSPTNMQDNCLCALDCIRTSSSPDRSYSCVMVVFVRFGYEQLIGQDFKGLVLELVSEGVYKRVGRFFTSFKADRLLLSKRRRGIIEEDLANRTPPYEHFPFKVA
jgi:hypothetical protein